MNNGWREEPILGIDPVSRELVAIVFTCGVLLEEG